MDWDKLNYFEFPLLAKWQLSWPRSYTQLAYVSHCVKVGELCYSSLIGALLEGGYRTQLSLTFIF